MDSGIHSNRNIGNVKLTQHIANIFSKVPSPLKMIEVNLAVPANRIAMTIKRGI
jgi:hypothetical protein